MDDSVELTLCASPEGAASSTIAGAGASATALLGSFVDLHNLPDSPALLGAFHKTYLCVGLMSAFAAAIFMQLKRETRHENHDLPPRSREDDAA